MTRRMILFALLAGLSFSQTQCEMLANTKASPRLGRELFLAAEANDMAKVRQLLDKGASVDARGDQGLRALHCAAYNNNLDLAKLLMSRGADVNAQSYTGKTPLFFATSQDMIDLLKKHGAR